MARLEDITTGRTIAGIASKEPVTVVAVKWYGTAVLEITYKNKTGELLYRENKAGIDILDSKLPLSFDVYGCDMISAGGETIEKGKRAEE